MAPLFPGDGVEKGRRERGNENTFQCFILIVCVHIPMIFATCAHV